MIYGMLILVPMFIQHVRIPGISYQWKNRVALVLFFSILFGMVAFRHETVGNDTVNYIHFFFKFRNYTYSGLQGAGIEPLFVLLCKVCSLVSDDYRFFFMVAAFIPIWLIGRFYCRESGDASLTIILFAISSVFVMLFSGVRQSIAIGIGVLALEFVRKKQFWGYLLCVVFAFGSHYSALLLLVLYPIYHAKITTKWLYGIIPAMIALFVFSHQIFPLLLELLSRYSRFEGSITNTGAYTMMILFVLLGVFSYVIPDEEKMNSDTMGLRNILLLVIVIQMFAHLHPLVMRLNYYFIPFVPVLIPQVIQCSKKRMKSVAMFARHVMVIAFVLYFFVLLLPSRPLHIYPYHFFWEDIY